MDSLTHHTPAGASVRFEIKGRSARIGRSSDNDVVLDGPSVSRFHAEIVSSPEGDLLADLNSRNGTFLNGRVVREPVRLRAGDRIGIGALTLVFNASQAEPLMFSDRPLPGAPDATFLPARSVSAEQLENVTVVNRIVTAGAGVGSRDRRIVSDVNRELFPQRPLDEVLETVMDIAHQLVGYERGLLMLVEKGEMVAKVRRLPSDERRERFEVSRTVVEHVRRLHESVLVRDALDDDRFRDRESIQDQHIRSVMCVPLLGDVEIGAIYVDCRRREGLFGDRELRDLTFLANLTAGQIENARHRERAVENERRNLDVAEAARIQRFLLPARAPSIGGYALEGSTIPCHEVGGDYYDYVELPGGRWGLVLADVAGKGVPAGMLMSNFQASLQLVFELDLPLAAVVERLNRRLCRILPDNRFIACFLGVLDPVLHTLTFVNAALSPPLLVRENGTVERLTLSTRALGMFDPIKFREETVHFQPGDLVCCYSDGVTEAENASGEMFAGDETLARLAGVLTEVRDRAPAAILDGVIAAVDGHCAAGAHQDDITVVVLKRST
jgi:serine phosphatase RsbU (regulator of sigma subunit)/pSer/pThr/pTyr-binding forkhead associated (FHA) protein